MARPQLIASTQVLKDAVGRSFPGCQAWVAKDGEVVLDVALGDAVVVPPDNESERTLTTRQTRYDLASLTKAIGTTVVAMRLHAMGMLDLNRRVVQDLGKSPLPSFFHTVTYGQLLNHSSGIVGYSELFKSFDPEHIPLASQAKTALAKKISSLERSYPTGTKTEYSDFGFMFLGWALERITGRPLPALFMDHVANPLGLTTLTCAGSEPVVQAAATERCPWRLRVLHGEVHDEHAFVLGGSAGHAGLFGTAHDVGKVCVALLNSFTGRDQRFLSRDTVRRFWDPSRCIPGSSWRLGFDGASGEDSLAGRHTTRWTVGHLGFTGTSLWIYPEEDTVIVLLSNRVHPTRNNTQIRETRQLFHTTVMEELDTSQPSFL